MAPTIPRLACLNPPDDETNLDFHRQEIEVLYCKKRWTLKEIMKWMLEQYNITAR